MYNGLAGLVSVLLRGDGGGDVMLGLGRCLGIKFAASKEKLGMERGLRINTKKVMIAY